MLRDFYLQIKRPLPNEIGLEEFPLEPEEEVGGGFFWESVLVFLTEKLEDLLGCLLFPVTGEDESLFWECDFIFSPEKLEKEAELLRCLLLSDTGGELLLSELWVE